MSFILIAGWTAFACLVLAAAGFMMTSFLEKKPSAAFRAALVFIPLTVLWGALLLFPFPLQQSFILIFICCGILAAVFLVLPFGLNQSRKIAGEMKRVDERDAIFHRFLRLKPGMPEFETFYKQHPELVEMDEKIRALPFLDEPGTETYNRFTTGFNAAIFEVMEHLFHDIEWTPAPLEGRKAESSPKDFTRRIKGFARYLGADLVGITKLDPAHVYSHIGRSPGKWGESISLDHTNAIVLACEMRYDQVRHAPHHITTTESSFQYLRAGTAALSLARYIHKLGYEARPHIDGNYRVMCVPIAVDAGLGELGRLGLLITPRFGPRVRLSVVTTDLPLEYDKPVSFGVQNFCGICKKCAVNCPSGSIERGEKQICNGVEKWQSNQESCFKYWKRVGSDCSICLKVCPYSHPDTLMHRMVRQMIARNPVAQRLALAGDDFFYGRRPKHPVKLPDWHTPG